MSINTLNPFTTTIPKLENVTEKYRFISTGEFIRDVESLGYKLVNTSAPRRGLGMHTMSFTHPGMPAIEGLEMRLLATNSHDGTSAFRLYIEVLVQVCSNGLVAWRSDFDARVVHRGYAIDKVQAAVQAVRARFDGVLGTVNAMQSRDVTPENAAAFLNAAAELRDAKPFHLSALQTARHAPQRENNAWNVFNRVQESLIRGGYVTRDTVKNAAGVDVIIPGSRARELKAVKERLHVNKELWTLALKHLLGETA